MLGEHYELEDAKPWNQTILTETEARNGYDVSVIIPYYEASQSIYRAVASVLAQQCVNCEIVIINDGSSRVSTTALSPLRGHKDIHVMDVLRRGPAAARNLGVERARAPIISFLDADDELSPQTLRKKIDALKGSADIGLVFGRVRVLADQINRNKEISPYCASLTLETTLGSFPVLTSSNMLVRREAFEDVGRFDESLRRASDQEWSARLCLNENWRAVGIDFVSVNKHVSPSSFWAKPDELEYAWREVLAAITAKGRSLEDDEADCISALFHWRLARYSMLYANDMDRTYFYLGKALTIDPAQLLKKYIHAASRCPSCAALLSLIANYGEGVCSDANSFS